MAESRLDDFGPAPEFRDVTAWLNSRRPSLSKLRGKVVLIDFWTYSCINCLRALPYIERWDAAYRDKGLVIVSVHTPEFAFETPARRPLPGRDGQRQRRDRGRGRNTRELPRVWAAGELLRLSGRPERADLRRPLDGGGGRNVAGANARLRIRYHARKAHLVLGSDSGPKTVRVFVGGRRTRTLSVAADKLYTLASSPEPGEHVLELRADPGTEAYAFTFG